MAHMRGQGVLFRCQTPSLACYSEATRIGPPQLQVVAVAQTTDLATDGLDGTKDHLREHGALADIAGVIAKSKLAASANPCATPHNCLTLTAL